MPEQQSHHVFGVEPPCFFAIYKQAASSACQRGGRYYAWVFSNGVDVMSSEYSLADVLERIYHNQLALEAAVMELTLWAEQQNAVEVGDNVRGALYTIGENAGHIKQGLARLSGLPPDRRETD
jgi:hypothetical protein